jgi:hypothetical protein
MLICRASAEPDTRRVRAHPAGHAWARPRAGRVISPASCAPQRGQMIGASKKTSGSVNRSLGPESVRYMSVTSVVLRRLLTNDDRR